MTAFVSFICFIFACTAVHGQKLWQPSPGHTQLPIWPGAPPKAQATTGPETTSTEKDHLVAGKPWEYVERVSQPTMAVYSPKAKETGAAVVVLPRRRLQDSCY
jgi:hypothetical protein